MATIYEDLYQFTSYIAPINLTFNQYLINCEEPILVHTGSIEMTKRLLPQLKTILGDKQLKYIFVSHFESDECGGLSLLLKNFPQAKTIGSEITARQLLGFGITDDIVIKNPGEKLIGTDYELEFISYPSQMHLWEGLLMIENKRSIFFSSDLMFRNGETTGEVIEKSWESELKEITLQQIPNKELKENVMLALSKLSPNFIATGHGPCIKI